MSKGAKFYEIERLKKQNQRIIAEAWLIFQEMNLTHDQVETNTLKMISSLLKHKQMDEVQKKM